MASYKVIAGNDNRDELPARAEQANGEAPEERVGLKKQCLPASE